MSIKDESMYIEIKAKNEPGITDRLQSQMRLKGLFIEKYEMSHFGENELKYVFTFNKEKSQIKDPDQIANLIWGWQDVVSANNIENLI